MSKICWWRC